MENDRESLRLGSFVSTRFKNDPQSPRLRRLAAAAAPAPERKRRGGIYLAVRLGVCVLLFCCVLTLKLANTEKSRAALGFVAEVLGEEADPETRLGRLRFVQIPSIIDVFAPSEGPALPVAATGFSLMQDDTLLALTSEKGQSVTSPAVGLCGSVGRDELLGGFVSVRTGADAEYFVYGIEDIRVEKDQPLTKSSILGSASGGSVYVRVYKSGRPVDPSQEFDLGRLQ